MSSGVIEPAGKRSSTSAASSTTACSVAEQRVELGLDADHRVEAASLLPLLEEIGDAGEGVAFGLEPGDQPQPAEVRLVVPAGPSLEPGRCEQALRPVEPHGRRGHLRPPGELVEAELLRHVTPIDLALYASK